MLSMTWTDNVHDGIYMETTSLDLLSNHLVADDVTNQEFRLHIMQTED